MPVDGRLRVDVHRTLSQAAGLRHDVRQGLLAAQKTLPPKYFYDDHGAQLTRNTIAKREPGEHGGAEPIGGHTVHQRDCGIDGNEETQERQRQENPSIGRFDAKQCQRAAASATAAI